MYIDPKHVHPLQLHSTQHLSGFSDQSVGNQTKLTTRQQLVGGRVPVHSMLSGLSITWPS